MSTRIQYHHQVLKISMQCPTVSHPLYNFIRSEGKVASWPNVEAPKIPWHKWSKKLTFQFFSVPYFSRCLRTTLLIRCLKMSKLHLRCLKTIRVAFKLLCLRTTLFLRCLKMSKLHLRCLKMSKLHLRCLKMGKLYQRCLKMEKGCLFSNLSYTELVISKMI